MKLSIHLVHLDHRQVILGAQEAQELMKNPPLVELVKNACTEKERLCEDAKQSL